MNRTVIIFGLILFVVSACQNANRQKKDSTTSSLTIELTNTTQNIQKDAVVVITYNELKKVFGKFSTNDLVVKANDYLPLQWVKADDGTSKVIVLVNVDEAQDITLSLLKANEPRPEFKQRAQAEISIKKEGEWQWITKKNGNEQFEYQGGEFNNICSLRVPDEHTDHSFYIRYEGPRWESDKVGYRFYIDWRNAVDVFGKRIPEMVLQNVGQDGFESYHEIADWGMDLLKVGKSLGLGSIGYWNSERAIRVAETDSLFCEILDNGPVYASFETKYYGWRYSENNISNLKVKTSIMAGSRLTNQVLSFSSVPENICTGIVKHKNVEFLKSQDTDNEWMYIATFGIQSQNKDHLGMMVFFKKNQLIEITEDEHSYVVILKPDADKIEYKFGATWELDEDKIASKEQFVKYLQNTEQRLNNPIIINY